MGGGGVVGGRAGEHLPVDSRAADADREDPGRGVSVIERGSSLPVSPGRVASRVFRVPLHVSERRLLLIGGDLLAANAALILALGVLSHPVSLAPLIDHPPWFALLSGLWLVICYAFDPDRPPVTNPSRASPT